MKTPLSLEAFADWLGTMPADGRYEYANQNNCAFCQYLKFLGVPYTVVDPYDWHDQNGAHPLPNGIDEAVICDGGPIYTFGEAHQRALALLGRAQ